MSDLTTLARPYAKAAFAFAKEQHVIAKWGEMLQFVSQIVQDPAVASLLANPRLTKEKRVDLLLQIASDQLSGTFVNFIRILNDHGRLHVLPGIATAYQQLEIEQQQIAAITLISATPLSDEKKVMFKAQLAAKLGRSVALACKTDAKLLGGAVIRVQDHVIDGSVWGRLNRLAQTLN